MSRPEGQIDTSMAETEASEMEVKIELTEGELQVLSQYLVATCTKLLDIPDEVMVKALKEEHAKDVLRQFAEEGNRTLVVAKIKEVKQEDQDEEKVEEMQEDGDEYPFKLAFNTQIEYRGPETQSIAFLKRQLYHRLTLSVPDKENKELVDLTKVDLSSQLQVINLGYMGDNSNIFDLAFTYVDHSLLPIFQDYKKNRNKANQTVDKTVQGSLDSVLTAMAGLKTQLASCIQYMEVPMVQIETDPMIKEVFDQAKIAMEKGERQNPVAINDFEHLIMDKEFIERLVQRVQEWSAEIQKVLKMEHNIENGTTMHEVQFWQQMEQRLTNIREIQGSEEYLISCSILNQAKKFAIVVRLSADTDVLPKIRMAKDCTQFFKQLPIKLLLEASNIEMIQNSVRPLFEELRKVKRIKDYDLERVVMLVSTVCRDIDQQIKKVVNTINIMQSKFEDYRKVHMQLRTLKESWKVNFTACSDDLFRKSNINVHFKKKDADKVSALQENMLLERFEVIYIFRSKHHELEEVILKTFDKDKNMRSRDQAHTKIQEAYATFMANVKELDATPEGEAKWRSAIKVYEQSTIQIEQEFANLIKEKLSYAKTAKDMFSVFSTYNKLLKRKTIRGAIQNYQSDLLTQVMTDIQKLRERLQQESTKRHVLSQVRDFPVISNRIVWIDQLKRRLQNYEVQVANVLGENWNEQNDAEDIKKECHMVNKLLHSSQKYYLDAMKKEINNIDVRAEKDKTIYRIESWGDNFNLCLNINEDIFDLHKEQLNLDRIELEAEPVKFLKTYGVQSKINELKNVYPIAMSLKQSIRTFQVTNATIKNEFKQLIAKQKNEALDAFKSGFKHIWRNENTVQKHASKLSVRVIEFEDKVNLVKRKQFAIIEICENLRMKPEIHEFPNWLKKIQDIVDDFQFNDCSNLDSWVADLNAKIEEILLIRLQDLLQTWITEFKTAPHELPEGTEHTLIKGDFVLDIQIFNQKAIMLEPSLHEGRAYWYKQLHKQVEKICGLRRMEKRLPQFHGRADEDPDAQEDKTYKSLLLRMGYHPETGKQLEGPPKNCEFPITTIKDCYEQLESTFEDAKNYYEEWKSFQSLWDIQLEEVFKTLKDSQGHDDIGKWNQLLTEVLATQKTIATNEDFRSFGRMLISYNNVQQKVNQKYGQIHKEILNRFGETLGQKFINFRATLKEARQTLEKLNIMDSDVTTFVTIVNDMLLMREIWDKEMTYCNRGEKVLKVQKYERPKEWMGIGPVDEEYHLFKQVLQSREKKFEQEKTNLVKNIEIEEQQIGLEITKIKESWDNGRPNEASDHPKMASSQIGVAMNQLEAIGKEIQKVKEKLEGNSKAKELLRLGFSDPKQLEKEEQEWDGLKKVWDIMKQIWDPIDSMMNETPFNVYQHKNMKTLLAEAQQKLGTVPRLVLDYDIFQVYKTQLTNVKKFNDILSELRGEAVKKQHWGQLLSVLKSPYRTDNMSQMTVWHFWELDLLALKSKVQGILDRARGQYQLEEQLSKSKELWGEMVLDLAKYKSKCKLIRGWDDLRMALDDDIKMLASMRMSQFFKDFQEQIESWDEKLSKMMLIFDSWQEIQMKYVYLEGIFFGSADIKTMLANEFNRFKDVDNKFIALMKKVNGNPQVLQVCEIPDLQKDLDKWAKHLNAIKKALGDYLEKQRQAFARFYFVGDDDLLEIIGNSREIKQVMRHFPKMFAGITSVQHDEKGDEILGMNSREGEIVEFTKKVVISEDPTINKWLTKVQEMMQFTLATILDDALKPLIILDKIEQQEEFNAWIVKQPSQICGLAMQIDWSRRTEEAFRVGEKGGDPIKKLEYDETMTNKTLEILAERVLTDMAKEIRQKYEQLITECVHQRQVIHFLIEQNAKKSSDFAWLYYMRFYYRPEQKNILEKLDIQMGISQFYYGFEYLGVGEKLVQAPLNDRCYLTLTQALHWRMGGSPFGPAGTGKTESVKALGAMLGRFTLVFNCDETFDGQAMGRIFVGLCQVGAYGCFDEFNRLEERMLSAVSQQILQIQTGLKEGRKTLDMLDRSFPLNQAMGIFITMNPDYAGRSNLPDNLKQLFRQMAMTKPDKDLIAQVMLFSQGFKTAERLSGKMVQLFDLCLNQLSNQSHYDFGLRALKSVLVSSGNLKRSEKKKVKDPSEINAQWEENILLKSLCDTLVPKLIAEDIPLLSSLLAGVFPGSKIIELRDEALTSQIHKLSLKYNLLPTDTFVEKVLQVYQIQNLCHGVMMVGPTGVGKTAAWTVLLEAMGRIDGTKGIPYVIDPKAIDKDSLYGKLDSTTAEWTDGVFTKVLRNVIDNARGQSGQRHWLIFDGDVDPEWAENLNSVLDDNKLLTLPSGERLQIPPNVRIMFEVETLKYATLATVSRCGMVWFSEETVTPEMIYHHYLCRLAQDKFDSLGEEAEEESKDDKPENRKLSPEVIEARKLRKHAVDSIRGAFDGPSSFMSQVLANAAKKLHVMEFTTMRVLEATFALVRKGIEHCINYNDQMEDEEDKLSDAQVADFVQKWTVFSTIWGVGGSMGLALRTEFSNEIAALSEVEMPPITATCALIDYDVCREPERWGHWRHFRERVIELDIDDKGVTNADTVITTIDTERHQEVLCSWLSEHRPFLLCGPPGSGKTMTLMATLKMVSDMDMIFINFSSSTTPHLILKQFDHYCKEEKTPRGLVLKPHKAGRWLTVFCDEINLPEADKYNTQVVITFLRQLTEQNGFWRSQDKQWISLERIQFVGACNPPTDAGRHPLSPRFLRHAPLILVDFPGPESLKQIYGTFNKGMLKRLSPDLRKYHTGLTEAMVSFYCQAQQQFTSDMQPHYIYSPRELTRWKLAIYGALEAIDTPEDLARIFVHEGLRLFEDRMVYQEEKDWIGETIDEIAIRCFPGINAEKALQRPIYCTSLFSQNYQSMQKDELKKHIQHKLKVFYEEELNVRLVVFDTVLDHVIRIDRVLKQPMGHLLLIGASGVGKTTLTKFVSWLQNLSIFQIKAGRNYSVYDFDEDLRIVMRRAGCGKERICFIFDESNVLSAAFLERMNALLAGGEVPGLFDGDDYNALIQLAKANGLNKDGLDDDDAIYKEFTKNVQNNLHVVFTMNPSNPDFSNRTASSPALFNRCVIDWFGDWSVDGMRQVATELMRFIDIPNDSFTINMMTNMIEPEEGEDIQVDPKNQRLSDCLVEMHVAVRDLNTALQKRGKKFNYITPRDFIDLVHHFEDLHEQKKLELNRQQEHLQSGLTKLYDTAAAVDSLKMKLKKFDIELNEKTKQAEDRFEQVVKEETRVKEMTKQANQKEIEVKAEQEEINEKTGDAERDLMKAEPALLEAAKALNGLDKKDIQELKAFKKPPDKIKKALEPVCALILAMATVPTWDVCIKAINNKDFLPNIMQFDKNTIKPKVKTFIMEKYLAPGAQYDIDGFYRASKAVGPLALWLKSIVEYADIYTKIEPLRESVKHLEQKAVLKRNELQELTETITELRNKKEALSTEYKQLLRQTDQLKEQKEEVSDQVNRAEKLLNNLNMEKGRWEESRESFKEQLSNLVGDVLLSAGFLTYIGFFDHYYRLDLRTTWTEALEDIHLKTTPTMSFVEYLSKPQNRIKWQEQALPNDELCMQNAIILDKFNRFPLIIDPSNQAFNFIMQHYNDEKNNRKIIKTSFADESFINHLINAIRYGLPLLVQDVELVDPFLNSVLNKEVQKKGGDMLMRVGDKEVQYFASFQMFMITRNQNAIFTPDLCSRVTFVNFTVTTSSLENQCLNIYLQNERPDIDEQRKDLLKLQGEKMAQLHDLEEALLTELSAADEGTSILENKKLIGTLETLKKESAQIKEEMAKAEDTLLQIEEVLDIYRPLASMSSLIFFCLQSMGKIHYLYQYSLLQFMDTMNQVLEHSEALKTLPIKKHTERLEVITTELFQNFNLNISQGLLEMHQMLFSMRLSQIRLKYDNDCAEIFNVFLNPTPRIDPQELSKENLLNGRFLSNRQVAMIEELDRSGIFNNIVSSMSDDPEPWIKFMEHQTPENHVVEPWFNGSDSSVNNEMARGLKCMTIIKILRPDRLNKSSQLFCEKTLTPKAMNFGQVDLQAFVLGVDPKSPLCLVSAPGFDASYKVELIAKQSNKKYEAVAIGSPEAFGQAFDLINKAAKTGNWVLLKNVHLAPQWLVELEKVIYKMTLNENFRLFLTMENNPKVPSTLLRASHVLVFEPPSGIKAALERSYKQSITKARSDKLPVQRSKMHFIVSWFNAVVQERLRYTPIGWSKVYPFNEADQRCTLDCVDEWLPENRNQVDPDQISWDALRTLISQSIFGGKIDNEYDQKILASLVDKFFCASSFDQDFPLFGEKEDEGVLKMPSAKTYNEFDTWIKEISLTESPMWSGLPNNAETLVNIRKAEQLVADFKVIQAAGEDEVIKRKKSGEKKDTGKAKWILILQKKCETLLGLMPEKLETMKRTEEAIKNPLFRFLEREVTVAASILKKVKNDLAALIAICREEAKWTNELHKIADSLNQDKPPETWLQYKVHLEISAAAWINDFIKRVEQLQELKTQDDFGKQGIWFGGLLFPEAYLTATQQYVAQENNWSLEELQLKFELDLSNDQIAANKQGFIINDMCMEGAAYAKESERIRLSETLSSSLPKANFKWIHRSQVADEETEGEYIQIPIYLNKQRKNLLSSVRIPTHGITPYIWYQRGVAIFAWSLE